MRCNLSLSVDIVLPYVPVLSSFHDYAPAGPVPPLPPPSPTGIAIESLVNMYWPPGVLMGKGKFSTDVVHRGRTIVLEGHDCGPMLIHLQVIPSPANVLTIKHILESKRKTNFSAGEIKANGKPIAHCILTNGPPLPMSSCGLPSLPTTDSPTSHGNSVSLGVHWIDLLAGYLSIVVNLVWDMVTRKMPSTGAESWGELLEEELVDWFWGLLGYGSNVFGDGPADGRQAGAMGKGFTRRNITGNIVGGVRLAGQLMGVYHGDGRIGLSSGQGPLSVGVSYTRDGSTHENVIEAKEGIEGPLGFGELEAAEGLHWTDANDIHGTVEGTAGLGGAQRQGELDTREGWEGSGHWPAL